MKAVLNLDYGQIPLELSIRCGLDSPTNSVPVRIGRMVRRLENSQLAFVEAVKSKEAFSIGFSSLVVGDPVDTIKKLLDKLFCLPSISSLANDSNPRGAWSECALIVRTELIQAPVMRNLEAYRG